MKVASWLLFEGLVKFEVELLAPWSEVTSSESIENRMSCLENHLTAIALE